LFAEAIPEAYFSPLPRRDIVERLADLIGPVGPTGSRDKILILSDAHDPHADAVAIELVRRGASVFRFDPGDLGVNSRISISLGEASESQGYLRLRTGDFALDEIKSVWFRRPNLPRSFDKTFDADVVEFLSRESEAAIRGLFALLKSAFWVGYPDTLRIADNKLDQLRVAQSLGLVVPRTLVTNNPEDALAFFDVCGGEMIVKSFCGWSGSVSGRLSAVCTSRVTKEHLPHFSRIALGPCLFQEYVPKDVEFRITVVGSRVFATEIHSQQSVVSRDDWRRYDIANTPYVASHLPSDVEGACLALLAHYGLNFGCIDMIRRPDGSFVFLEVNANGQWLWIQELTGAPIIQAIADILIAAAPQRGVANHRVTSGSSS
jgi:glutathione synthase/RimK-type ligase-like ATP-grasp enzyme